MQDPNLNDFLRLNISEKYRKTHKDLLDDFFKLNEASFKIQGLLILKMDRKKRFYYQTFLHNRASNHFANAIFLLSQRHVIDAYTLARSALEVVLLIVNFDINPAFFNLWYQDGKRFKIKPAELRENIKNDPHFSSYYQLFDIAYKKLSEVLHPTKRSVTLSIQTIAEYKDGNTNDYKKHTILFLASYTAYINFILFMLYSRCESEEEEKMIDSVVDILKSVDSNKWLNSLA
ncbi:DUF5677 domain-containing protein [Priestia aryabhattai]|uniref:DUF5677 domain-containing protein n=1 Tax=Priestia aryabhattai TaxID=412384 RepID=UPI002109B9F5|nr:DUF5677 domain-containing protein [Priestia aryabhattai]